MNFSRSTPPIPFLLVASALALLAAPASAASAHAPIVAAKASATVSGASGTIGTARAKCPAGTSVVSGGVHTYASIDLNGSDTQVLIPFVSRRSGPRAWIVSVYSVGQPILTSKRFTAIAYCRRGLGHLVARSRRGSVSIGQSPIFPMKGVAASCPQGTRPVSGGFAIRLSPADLAAMAANDGGPAALVFGSRVVGAAWEVTVGKFSNGRTVFRSLAYCSAQTRKIRSKVRFLRGAGQLRDLATPACPRGTLAISAGFYAPLTFRSNDVGATIPLETSRMSRKRWKIGAVPLSSAPSRSTAYTYCG